jgi:predicted RNA-binding Zn-ribbon protein involved in translation (DUF1610 family)
MGVESADFEEAPEVVHPHGCPKCGSDQLNRIHRAWEEIERPLDRLWTHYEGLVGLKAAVKSGAPETVVAAGVNGHRIVCVGCGHKGELREFVTANPPTSGPT